MPQLPAGWKETTLGKLLDVKHGFAFKWDYISDKDNGNVLLTPWNFAIWGGWKDWKKFYNWEIPISYILKWWEIVITMTDLSKDWDTLGFPAIVPIDDKRVFLHNQRIWLVEFISDNLDLKYCFYKLKTNEYQKYIVNTASWSTVRHTSPDKIKSFIFHLPPLPEQQAIAAVLSSFDDKIELLRAENQTLEQMGQELFKERFGKSPNIKVWMLGDWVDVKRGSSPRPIQDYISEKGYKWLKISDASAVDSPFIFDIKECIREEGLNKTILLKSGTLVLSNSATPGIPKILAIDSCIHDGWLHFPKSRFSNEFLYLLFKEIRPKLIQQGSGSVFTNLKTDILKKYEIPIPDQETLSKFDLVIKPLFNKIRANSEQIQTLSATRDQLLPKLMSGEVRVEF